MAAVVEDEVGRVAALGVSVDGGGAQPARLAGVPPAIPSWSPLHDPSQMSDSLRRGWPLLGLFAMVALGLMAGVKVWLGRQISISRGLAQEKLVNGLLVVVLVVRVALFVNHELQLPGQTGFDHNGLVQETILCLYPPGLCLIQG